MEAETKPRSIHEGGRGHGPMANSRHSIGGLGQHGTLLRLGEDDSTASWGGSIEAIDIQPTGTLHDGREALLRTALALANPSRLREGRALTGEGG